MNQADKTILIIDDYINENVKEAIEILLKNKLPKNTTFKIINDSTKAYMFFKSNYENIILSICDYAMPGCDGRQLLEHFKKIDKHAKIVIMTHLNNEVQYLQSLNLFDHVQFKLDSYDDTLKEILKKFL